jgi:cytochrome c-type biogenesis protein CcmF
MPWLMGAALLHSAVVTEKRGALPGWTLFLAIAAFTFSMLGAFLVRSGVLTSVHAFAVDPERGLLLLGILGLAAGAAFALFAWRAPNLAAGGQFKPVSRESAIVANNIVLTAAAAAVMFGTLFPLIREALDGQTVSVGPPYFNLIFVPIMVVGLVILPFGPMLAWKRGDLAGAARRLAMAALVAVGAGILTLAVVSPRKAVASAGVMLGFWLLAGAVAEVGERARAFRAPWGEVRRRLGGLPRGAWGSSLAHFGLGLFILGACFETAWKIELAEPMNAGRTVPLGGYELTLEKVEIVDGPNYLAERGLLTVRKGGRIACTARPERRFYPAGGQTTQEVAICYRGLDQVYITLGERRATLGGQPAWLIRGYFNPWVQLIFLGPLLMALGGAVSLSDRRLRLAAGQKSKGGQKSRDRESNEAAA